MKPIVRISDLFPSNDPIKRLLQTPEINPDWERLSAHDKYDLLSEISEKIAERKAQVRKIVGSTAVVSSVVIAARIAPDSVPMLPEINNEGMAGGLLGVLGYAAYAAMNALKKEDRSIQAITDDMTSGLRLMSSHGHNK
mgnify:CR=1 FL=1